MTAGEAGFTRIDPMAAKATVLVHLVAEFLGEGFHRRVGHSVGAADLIRVVAARVFSALAPAHA